ncbi:MAG: FecR domain-containing protein [Sedimenticola sp.]
MPLSTSRTTSVVFIVLTLLLIPFSLHAADAIGRVAVLQGAAHAVGADGTRRPLHLSSKVFMSDHLTTAEKGRLQVIFSDKTTLTLGPSSTIVIDKYVYQADKSAGAFVATATKGFFRMITGNISRLFPDRVKVKTPAATIGIRGCLLAWSVDAGGHPLELLYLGGLQGRERGIYAENGGGMSDLFNPEHGIRVSSPGAPPSLPTRWSAEAMMALLGPTVLHLPPSGASFAPSGETGWVLDADIDAPDDLDFEVDPDIDREVERARSVEVDQQQRSNDDYTPSVGNDLAPGYY